MNYKLVCVGGTGQMVLHYYAQFYLLGLIEQPFEAAVIDTDAPIASVQGIHDFFSNLQFGADPSDGVESSIPLLHIPALPIQGDDKVGTALTGKPIDQIDDRHAVRAFFHQEAIDQSISQGLYARPALSSVMPRDIFNDPSLSPKSNSIVAFVGSVIGGTSGGLLAPIVDAMKQAEDRNRVKELKMRAILYGRYFDPDNNILKDAVLRFNSNQVLVLQSIREALQQLDSYCIVGGTGPATTARDPNLEKSAMHLPWQNEDEPFWFGSQAAEYLLKDTTKERALNFSDREVASDFKRPIVRDAAVKTLRQRISLVNAFVERKVVERLSREPWVRSIWGARLLDVIAAYWRIAVKAESGKHVSDFPDMLQSSLVEIWAGDTEHPGLRTTFPIVSGDNVRPADIANVVWPSVDESKINRNLFTSARATARRTAATLIFTLLRKGS